MGPRTGRRGECKERLERDTEKNWRERGGDAGADGRPRGNMASGEVRMLRNGKCIFRTMMPYNSVLPPTLYCSK